VETVNDVSKACSMALSILNDLLNYDKLEDGTLLIEPKKVVALPFILKSTEVLNLQVKEKGLILTFDLDDSSPCAQINLGVHSDGHNVKRYGMSNEAPWGVSSCLSSTDFINVDPHKMNQVIGNLVSNAIKFTPAGQGIIVKARKVVPDTFNGASTRSTSITGKARDRAPNRLSSLLRRLHSRMFRGTSVMETDVDMDARVGIYTEKHRRPLAANNSNSNSNNSSYSGSSSSSGYLVLEVIDSGVGMAPEDSKRLFKEIVQFNPSKLQVQCSTSDNSSSTLSGLSHPRLDYTRLKLPAQIDSDANDEGMDRSCRQMLAP
jgi:signal transduction histidine kinase